MEVASEQIDQETEHARSLVSDAQSELYDDDFIVRGARMNAIKTCRDNDDMTKSSSTKVSARATNVQELD